MGNYLSQESTPEEPSESGAESKWRDDGFEKWDAEACKELADEVSVVCDQIREVQHVGKLRILLLGPTVAGKSSLINNINAAVSGKHTMKSLVSQSDQQVTKTYDEYEITKRTTEGRQILPCVICDFKGFGSAKHGASWEDVEKAVLGKLIDGQKLQSKDTETSDTAGGVAQMVFIVFDASQATQMNADLAKTLINVKDFATDKGIRCAVFLTKCDSVDSSVKNNLARLHVSSDIHKAVQAASSSLGVPENRVFPVKNYTSEVRVSPPMQFQTLFALKIILEDINEVHKRAAAKRMS